MTTQTADRVVPGRIAVTVSMPKKLVDSLERLAVRRRKATGLNVTRSELCEEGLDKFLESEGIAD